MGYCPLQSKGQKARVACDSECQWHDEESCVFQRYASGLKELAVVLSGFQKAAEKTNEALSKLSEKPSLRLHLDSDVIRRQLEEKDNETGD